MLIVPSVVRLLVLLALLLSACTAPGQPPRSTLEQALNLQVQLTRQDLAEVLAIPAPNESPTLSRVRLDSQARGQIEGRSVWHLRGRFDWRLAGEPLRPDTPFEVWLLPGERGQSWRLLRRADQGEPGWRSWPLPLPVG
ncbi:MAG: hypothetical protein K9J72_00685 [Synechococcus sp. Tobar2m-G35]|jgi:hypothetical protein|nr:hypothetical protein [Synechococcus sp. Tobar2m-G35]